MRPENIRLPRKCSSTICVWVLLPTICMTIYIMRIHKTDQPRQKLTYSISTSDFDKAVEMISRLRSNHTSLYGLRYRSIICTVVRNDPHLAEFLLRHLISGFSHIVVYDNNRILAGHDTNISTLLAPFIAAGTVTYVSWRQNSTEPLPNGDKNNNGAECLHEYGQHADWMTILDTDEYFYYARKNVAVNTLNDLLLELEQHPLCAITILWTMMYGEGRMLKQNNTLFESYPRVCRVLSQTKVLARPSYTIFDIPHNAACKTSDKTSQLWTSTETSTIGLIHYYSKSIEEFLVKGDQSIPPYTRKPIQSYLDSGPVCDRVQFVYSEDYRRIFLNTYRQLAMLHSLTPIALLPSPALNVKTMPDYTLYIHLKYRCAMRQEFDNERYLSITPDAKKSIENGNVTDGLQHFMINFLLGVKGCWKTETYSICE